MNCRRPWTLYRRYVVGGAVGLAAAALVGFAGLGTPLLEVFPFYSWILFPVEPNGQGYEVYVERVGEKAFDPAPAFKDSGSRNARSVVLFRVIQRLGKAAEAGDEEGVARQRAYLEAAFDHGTVYRLDAREADPVELWRTKLPARERTVRTFLYP
ncbi:MAG TPA: hypothetical protein VIM58_01675 [Candidatus Methylacidiphilales bacterium]